MEPTYFEAVYILTDNKALHGKTDGPLSKITLEKDVVPPNEEAIQTKLASMISDWEANQYQRDRQYPSIGDQLDMQYHDEVNGTTTWKDAIAKVKADNPKD